MLHYLKSEDALVRTRRFVALRVYTAGRPAYLLRTLFCYLPGCSTSCSLIYNDESQHVGKLFEEAKTQNFF